MTCHFGIKHGYINKILMANGYEIIAKKKKIKEIEEDE